MVRGVTPQAIPFTVTRAPLGMDVTTSRGRVPLARGAPTDRVPGDRVFLTVAKAGAFDVTARRTRGRSGLRDGAA
jgi:hypothetical protein